VKKDVGVIVATPKIEPEEIGPIMGRKKKQKKEKVTTSSSATPTVSRPETPVTEKKDPTPAPPKEVKEAKDDSSTYRSVAYETMSLTEDTPPIRGKAADLKGKAKDNEASSAALSSQTQISPATVFRQLIEDNYYPEGVEALNFIKPVASSNDKHRHDQSSASQAARDLLDKNLIEPQAKSIVQEEDQAILLEGRPVRKLVDGLRVMLTPYGDCVRNLTPDEEERYLELQERVAEEASSPAVFVANRHEPSPGFSLIKGRAVPNGPPGYFPQAPGAFPQDPVNKIQREEAIYYINQYVLPRLNLGTTGFPGPWKNALQDGKVNLNAATANFNSTIAPYIDTAAPELSYPVPSPGGSSVGLADALSGHQHNSPSQNLASVLVNSLGPWPEPAHGAASSGAKFTGPTTSGGPFGSVPLMSQEDAEHALAAARKETEKLEKQLNQKIKKNRQFLNIDNNAAKLGMLTTAH
jgi:CCR4-NOT transcription complex subunit 4